jgi:serine/threonine protein kinase
MEDYKTIAPIGKGAYGNVTLVQSLIDKEIYIMKVS